MDIYDDNKININIYAVSDGLFYKEDEYEPDRKYLYKYLMNKIVDKWINNDECINDDESDDE